MRKGRLLPEPGARQSHARVSHHHEARLMSLRCRNQMIVAESRPAMPMSSFVQSAFVTACQSASIRGGRRRRNCATAVQAKHASRPCGCLRPGWMILHDQASAFGRAGPDDQYVRCRKWVKRYRNGLSAECPLSPRWRPNSGHRWRSVWCQQRT